MRQSLHKYLFSSRSGMSRLRQSVKSDRIGAHITCILSSEPFSLENRIDESGRDYSRLSVVANESDIKCVASLKTNDTERTYYTTHVK